MPRDFGPKHLKLKRGDVRVKTRGGLTALVWKDFGNKQPDDGCLLQPQHVAMNICYNKELCID